MTAHPAAGISATTRDHVLRTEGGATITARVHMADGFWGRFRGLMGHPGLADDEGLLLATNSIHMLFMRFPIDALFLGAPEADGHQRVVAIRQGLRPWTGVVWYVRGAVAVVELPAGTIAQTDLHIGSHVALRPAETAPTPGQT